MTDPRDIKRLIDARLSRVLTMAEAALPEKRFMAFRKLVLDEFGRNGLERELYDLIGNPMQRNGSGRAGQNQA